MQYRVILAGLSVLLASPRAGAQMDTVRPTKPFGNEVMVDTGSYPLGYGHINNIAFPDLPGFSQNYLYDLFFVKGLEKGWDPARSQLTIDKLLTFRNCSNYPIGDMAPPFLPDAMSKGVRFVLNQGLEINGAKAKDYLEIGDVVSSGVIMIKSSDLGGLDVEHCRAQVVLSHSALHGAIWLTGQPSSGTFICYDDQFLAALNQINIHNWTLVDETRVGNALYKNLAINFVGDTVWGSIRINNELTPAQQVYSGPEYGNRVDVLFQDCYIDGQITVDKNGQHGRVSFKHCNFGPHASTISLLADTVSFTDCSNLPASASLQLTANNNTCWLQLEHTNLGDVSFIYGPNLQLAFERAAQPDEYTGVYETLLSKFRNEGKKDSYERVDIEYHRFKAAKGNLWDRIADWAQAEWWNYGYSKLLVVWWTFLLLGIFFLFNALFWPGMQEVYPIPQEYLFVDRHEWPLRYRALELLRVFLYTVYVFFSIKIDLGRLKVTNPWLVGYFFVQWLVGLWCLFFIVNALLKIG